MIRLGGLQWSLALAVEFWHTTFDGVIAHPAELSQRDIEEHAVDHLGGAALRPTAGIAAGSASAANDGDLTTSTEPA